MSVAICFKCGHAKTGALSSCANCRATPTSPGDTSLSLVLSLHVSSKSQLAHYSHELRNHLRLSVSSESLSAAEAALRDPQLLGMLKAQAHLDPVSHQVPAEPESAGANPPRPAQESPLEDRKLTSIDRTPFAILGATPRDDRRRIVELAEQKSLDIDPETCQKARSDLTNPRTRVAAEMSWLPGVSPRKASQLLEKLRQEPLAIRSESGLPNLAHLNLIAAAFESVDARLEPDQFSEFVQETALLADAISAEEVLRDINEDRSVSGFPQVQGLDQIEGEIEVRRTQCRTAIRDALNRLPAHSLIEAMTAAVAGATSGGNSHAPRLIDDLVDSYEVETQAVLQSEAENVRKLIQAAREAARHGEAQVKSCIDKLEPVARNWVKIAAPIQLSAKARGVSHEASRELAFDIRSLAIDLFNKHDMLGQSQRLTDFLRGAFADLPEFSERVHEDKQALADISETRKQAATRQAEWEREITYSAEIGLILKDTLSISPTGVSWKGRRYPLESITRVRWGGVSHSVNGIPTGTTYTIAFGDLASESVVILSKKNVYSAFVEKLWRAVCVRLICDIIESLRAGKVLYFGDAQLEDDGITFEKIRFLGPNEKVKRSWGQITTWSYNGEFHAAAKDDKKANLSLSYIQKSNVHLLEHMIDMAFKKPGLRRLSELL